MTAIYLIRHGQTDYNAQRRVQGHLDIPLNALGQAQASAAAGALHAAGVRNPLIHASDLSRARETAQAVQHKVGGELHPFPALRELNFGDWDGQEVDALARDWAADYAAFRAGRPDFTRPGGESPAQAGERVLAHLQAHWPQPGQTLVLVSHGLALASLLSQLLKLDYAGAWTSGQVHHVNAAYTRLSVGGVGEVLEADIGRADHLVDLA
ncbi:histidine phosphatase family protein [Deinococcus lacus]|uniref:Histidine phosphatase family protein n=1 Tax=Deinococcus lacus TaxID=392561 RepID=A0ABW1YA82_9DEIO